jgi:hypothetical protein
MASLCGGSVAAVIQNAFDPTHGEILCGSCGSMPPIHSQALWNRFMALFKKKKKREVI